MSDYIPLYVDSIAYPFLNTLRPIQNDYYFPNDTFKGSFLNKNVSISIQISLAFVYRCPINNISALIHMMAWHQTIIWTNNV